MGRVEIASQLSSLLNQISACQLCQASLPHSPRPVVRAHSHAKVLIIGQAPGAKVHASGVPWDDASGERLRAWLGIDKQQFYSPSVAIVPMGFCFPGSGKSGDLPPRKECAPAWHAPLLELMPEIELMVLIGQYAQQAYLPKLDTGKAKTLTENVKNYRAFLPTHLALPHPSPRNNIWLKKNPWFERDLVPRTQQLVAAIG